MADSNITVSGLTVAPGVGQLSLRWTVTNPNIGGLPYLDLKAVEVWSSTTNDRTTVTKVGEGFDAILHANVTPGQTRYYWLHPRDVSGLYGDWFPLSSTAGVSGTAGTAQPGPGTITATELAPDSVTNVAIAPAAVNTTELADAAIVRAKIATAAVGSAQIEDASITNAKIVSLNADKIVAASLDAISANIGNLSGGTISGTSLYATTINGGTISGGTINGVTINGTTINGGTISGATLTGVDVYGPYHTSTSAPGASIGSLGFSLYDSGFNQRVYMNTNSTAVALGASSFSGSNFAAVFRNTAAGAVQGISPTYAFYASGGGGYGPFTGAHEMLWPIDEPLPEVGDLIADVAVIFRNGVSNTICTGEIAITGDPVLGVYVAPLAWGRIAAMSDDMSDEAVERFGTIYRLILVNALGEGQINVCDEGGDIRAGDFLTTSSVPGKAMRQVDDTMRASTVARSRETVVFHEDDASRMVACVYVSG